MKNYTAPEILDILKKHSALLKKYSVKRIGLFGSVLNTEQNEESDIDFIVDFRKKSFDDFMELAFELEKLFGRKIDLLTEKSISPYLLPYIKDKIQWYEA